MPEQTKRILIVDDSPADLRLLANTLSAEGYIVHPASEGRLALEFVQATLPDLILLDITMPDMDGYQVCASLKAEECTREVPVIFISSLDHVLDKVKAFAAGGVDYVVKPFEAQEVLARVKTHLALRLKYCGNTQSCKFAANLFITSGNRFYHIVFH